MPLLLIVSLIWAFSFGLIKDGLAGLSPSFVAFVRLFIALLCFVPFLRIRTLRIVDAAQLFAVGTIQYGLMYVAYIHSFCFLQAYEVALFTIFTPLYVTVMNDFFNRRFCPIRLAAVALAIAGGAVIEYRQFSSPALWRGFLLMQAANLCFAFGQIFYRRIMARLPKKQTDLQVFGLLYLGAVFSSALATSGTEWTQFSISFKQVGILLYLGIVASGLGFFLWNVGARRIHAGVLAVFNNLKIPLGILVSVLFFQEHVDWPRLVGGGTLMIFALFLNRRKRPRTCYIKLI